MPAEVTFDTDDRPFSQIQSHSVDNVMAFSGSNPIFFWVIHVSILAELDIFTILIEKS